MKPHIRKNITPDGPDTIWIAVEGIWVAVGGTVKQAYSNLEALKKNQRFSKE